MSKKQLKVEQFNIRLTKSELIKLRYKASVDGVNVSEFLLSKTIK